MPYQNTMVQFGSWAPDDDRNINPGSPNFWLGGSEVPLQDAKNVIFTGQAYRPLPPPVAQGAALTGVLDGGTFFYGNHEFVIAGTASALYYSMNGGTSWASAGTGYTSVGWQFAQYGSFVYATDGVDPIQVMDLSSGSPSFAELAAAAPIGSAINIIRDFVVVGNITTGPVTGPYVIQWSGLAAPAAWDIPGTQSARYDQAGAQSLYSQYGQVQYIAQGEEMAMVFQQTGISRVQYEGGETVFGFYTFERKRGLITPRAASQVENTVYFLAADGFYATDGSSVQPIGYGKINRWFAADCANIQLVRAAADTLNQLVMWSYPNNSGGYSQLIYNLVEQKWTRGQYTTPLLFQGMNGTEYQPQTLDSSGYINTFTGTPTDCEITTKDFRFDPAHRAVVTALRLLTDDANQATAGIAARVSDQDPQVFVGYRQPEKISRQVSVRADGFMHAVNVRMTSAFTYAQGVGLTYATKGRR